MSDMNMPEPVIKGHGLVIPAAKAETPTMSAPDPSMQPTVRTDPTPTLSNKQPFDDSPVPGLVDHSNEGGIAPAGSSGSGYRDGISNTGSYFEQPEDDERYSLMGFKVIIKRPDGTVEGHDIRMNFDDKKVAMACLQGNKFKCKTPQGEPIEGEVVSGMPIVCIGGATSAEYVQNNDGYSWRRA